MQFVILRKLLQGREGSGAGEKKMFRHLSLTTSTTGREKKEERKKTQHSYATVGHFVNRRDGSVALKCQNKWRTRKERDRSGEKATDTGSELAGMDFTGNKWT